jgi:hypothetical protein
MLKRLLMAVALAAVAMPCAAQTITGPEFQTQQTGKTVVGTVMMCISGGNLAVPCGSSAPIAVTTTTSSSTIATNQVTIGTTATQVVPVRSGRSAVKITNLGTVDIFCGAAGVTTTTGDLLAGVKGGALTIPSGAAVFCVVATGTQAISFMETY